MSFDLTEAKTREKIFINSAMSPLMTSFLRCKFGFVLLVLSYCRDI